MSDGSITIDTSLDNSGIERDIGQTKQLLQRAGTEMGNQFQQVGNAAQSNMKAATQSISNLQTTMQQTANVAGTQLSRSLEQAAQGTSQSMQQIGTSLQTVSQQAEQAGEQAAQSMTVIDVTTSGMTTHIIQAGEELAQGVGNALGDLGDTINDDLVEPLDRLGDTVGGLDDDIGEPLDGLGEPIEDVRVGLVHIVDGIEEIEEISSEAFGGSINDIDKMAKELEEAEKSTKRVQETFSKLGTHIVDVMKKAGAAATAAFSVAMGAAVKVGMDFESGMSQVAATMGITTTEIAAGSKEFEALSQAAKNAGATTQFSATQASDALNYLALAGMEAEKSINALPTVLNLAAAGGIDLGYASDMVTDSMSALGLETSQLEGFVDQLAKTSQKSNTNVAQLGEAILTVGGTAKDLAGGTIELNTALGILADNGIKGAEGGTALRNMILSLSAPTDKAASEMERLGLEVFDANGNLRPLNETFQDLNGKLKEMSKEERINVLNTMFNKVDLKSVNALLANSGERFDELSGYIRDSAGAAADMADTMNDNLKGKLTILGSALEGLGIKMYEEFQQPFKEAAETAIKSVDSISYSLKNGKLSESMQTVARAIGSIVSKAAELAINALPKLIDGFAFLVDNAKILGTVLASTAGAVVTFKTTMLINDVVKSWQAAATAARVFGAGMSTSLTGMQAVAGVATGQLGALQAAVAALGSPMGVAALAVAGVTAGVIALSLATDEEAEKMKEWKESSEEMSKELENRKTVWQEVQNASREQISLNASEIDSTKEMVDELQSLVDENGKVGESKERVKYLTDKINEIAPDSIKWVDDETIAYEKEADAIKKALDQKKAAMAIDELQDDRTAAQKGMTEALEAQVKLREEIAEKEKALAEKRIEQNKATRDVMSSILDDEVKALETSLAESQSALEQNIKDYENYAETIDNVNKVEEAYANEHYEEVERILGEMNLSYKDARTASVEELQKQNEELQAKYDALVATIDDNSSEEAKKMKENIGNLLEETNQELQSRMETLKQQMEESGKNAVEGFVKGLLSGKGTIASAASSMASTAIQALNLKAEIQSPSKATERSGKYFDEGLAIGIEKNTDSVIDSIEELGESALKAAKDQTEDYKELGSLFIQNYTTGIKESFDDAAEVLEKGISEQTEIYKKAIEEQTETRTEKIEEQLANLKESYTDSEKELKEQIKKTKSESKKQELEQEIKENKKIYEQQKKDIEKQKQLIKDGGKEQIAAQKEAFQALGKAGKEAITTAYQQIEKEAKKRIDAVTDEFQSQKDEILSLQESLYSKTSEYGELFHYDEETGDLILNDLEQNTKAANDYYDALDRLESKGISQDFVKMIATEYDVEEGTKLLDELLSMSDERLQSYSEEWEKLQEVSTKRSKEFLSSELNVIDTEYNKALESTIAGIQQYSTEVLKTFWNEFLAMIPTEYAEALAIDPNMIDTVIAETNARLLGGINEIVKDKPTVEITTEVGSIPEQIEEQTPEAQEKASELVIAVADQAEDDGDEVIQTVDDIAKDSIQTMERHKGEFEDVGELYIDSLISGMQSKWNVAVSVASEIARSLKEELEEVATFSARETDEAISTRQLVESAEPSLISRLYDSMVDSINFQQSRVAAASASYITNNNQSSTTTNLGDVNFNIAEVKGNDAGNTINKLMEQAEFYRRQKNLAVGVR